MSTLAIDIGGTKFSVAVFEGKRMVERESHSTDREGGRDWMLAKIADVIRTLGARHRFDCCGIGFGGPVDFERQRVVLSTHVAGWSDFDLPGHLANLLGFVPVMDNDANAGALGEALYGAGRGYRPLFYLTLSTGIGGGLVASDTVYRGADSYAGEIGHLTVRPDGPECLCGSRGCLERMCCGLWLERDHGRPASELLRDPVFVERYVVDLALGLKAAIMLLNPARIVIGGGIAKAGDRLFVPLRAELGRQITAWSRARVDVVPAELGDDSILWGAHGAGHPAHGMTLPPFYPIIETVPAAEAVLEAGARILQFRHKGFFSRQVFEDASRIAVLCRSAGVLFVVNDRADVARLLNAALHLGQDDLAPSDARRIMPAASHHRILHAQRAAIARGRRGTRGLPGDRPDFRHRIQRKSRSGGRIGSIASLAAPHAKTAGGNRRHHPRISVPSLRSWSRLGGRHRRLAAGCARASEGMDRD